MRAILSALFAFSGFSALAYQVVWQRVLTQEIGVNTISISFIVAIFLGGLGLGSFGHRFTDRLQFGQKRILYVALEVGIGLFGFVSISWLREVNQAIGSSTLSQFAANFLLLLPATFAMGMTTPLILDLVRASDSRVGRTIGLFYGNNIFGAAIGAFVTGFALIELLGLQGVAHLAAAMNFFLALCFWFTLNPTSRVAKTGPEARGAGKPAYVLAAFLFGFAALNLQMVYFRTAFNHFQMFSFVFPALLGAFLLAMALGQYAFGYLADVSRAYGRSLTLALLFFTSSLLLFFSLPIEWVQAGDFVNYWYRFAVFALAFGVCIVIGSGMFTMLTRFATTDGNMVGFRFGEMMAATSAGNMLGALAAPIFLFETIGTVGVLLLSIAAYGIGILAVARPLRGRLVEILALTTAAVLAFAIPTSYFLQNRMFGSSGAQAQEIAEDATGIVSTFWYDDRKRVSIQISRSATSTIFHDATSADDYKMSPIDLLAPKAENRMLIIGLGGANYLPYLVESSRIGSIVVVELSKAVIRKVYENGTPSIRAAMDHPSVTIVHDDGRRFLMRAVKTGEQYDIIQNGVFQPWMSGAANLYTVEFASLARSAMSENGVYITLDLEKVAASAGFVFANAYSLPPGRYVYFSEKPEVEGLCKRVFDNTSEALNTDNHPIAEYWMLGLFSMSLRDLLAGQAAPYQHPC